MQRLLLVLTLVVGGPQRTGLNPQSAQAVIRAETEICRGYERNDVESVRRNLVDDYTLTDSKGVVTTKQDIGGRWMLAAGHVSRLRNSAATMPTTGNPS